jgi:hypothetical protein
LFFILYNRLLSFCLIMIGFCFVSLISIVLRWLFLFYSLLLFLYLFFYLFDFCSLQFNSISISLFFNKNIILKRDFIVLRCCLFSDCTFWFNKNQFKIHRFNKKIYLKNQCVGRENRGMDEKQRAKGLSESKIKSERKRDWEKTWTISDFLFYFWRFKTHFVSKNLDFKTNSHQIESFFFFILSSYFGQLFLLLT